MIRHGRNLAIYVNGVDISGDLNEINSISEQDMADVATFGAINHQAYPGLAKDSGTIQAIYNSTGATIFEGLIQNATGYGMMICFASTAGSAVYSTNSILLKNNAMKSIVSDVNRATVTFETQNYPFEAGSLLFPKAATATTNVSILDNLTSTLIGGVGYVQVFSVGSSGNFTPRIETSSTNEWLGEHHTIAVFSTSATATAKRTAISGTIERYNRCGWNITASTATFAVSLVRY